MRIMANGDSYFELNATADNVRDFVKCKWDNNDYTMFPDSTHRHSVLLPYNRIVFPGGLILFQGSFISVTDNEQVVNFDFPFPNECTSVMFGTLAFSQPTNITKDGFRCNRHDDYDGSPTVQYMAFGW